MIIFPRYVRPDEMWSRTAEWSATSEKVKYEAAHAGDDDPAWAWWANDTSGTLSADLGASRPVGIVALIHSNTEDGHDVLIGGDVTGGGGTIQGERSGGGYPRNVAFFPPAGATASQVDLTIAGHAFHWSIGEAVIGVLRTFSCPIMSGTGSFEVERSVISDFNPAFLHEIRHDNGSERWRFEGQITADDPALAEMMDVWESTRGGTWPLLFIRHENDEPRLVHMAASFGGARQGPNRSVMRFAFHELGRGKLLQ